jgi:hypothetical protein
LVESEELKTADKTVQDKEIEPFYFFSSLVCYSDDDMMQKLLVLFGQIKKQN